MRYAIVALLVLAVGTLLVGPAVAQTFRATIDGAQEVPPTGSPGTGLGCMTYHPATMMLDYDISYAGLLAAENNAHFHGPAPIGINAGVQFGLPLGPLKIGTVGPLTALQQADLFNGLWYINIHSALFPGGEIRGQVLTSASPCTVPVESSTWGSIKALYETR